MIPTIGRKPCSRVANEDSDIPDDEYLLQPYVRNNLLRKLTSDFIETRSGAVIKSEVGKLNITIHLIRSTLRG